MSKFSPKIEIINHFDNLINRVDIDIDSSLEKYNDKQILAELLESSENNRKNFRNKYDDFALKLHSSKHSSIQTLGLWTESTKVIDYLKQIRIRAIEELRKAQEDTLEYYKLNSARFKSELFDEKKIDLLRNAWFNDTHYFQLKLTQSEKKYWAFSTFTFQTDFYISPSEIDSLE